MIDPEEVEAIVAVVEARMRDEEPKALRRKHWPRRVALCLSVMAAAVATRWVIDHAGLAHIMQSAELGLAALFDSIFAKVKES